MVKINRNGRKAKKEAPAPADERTVVYPKPTVVLAYGDNAVTSTKMKELLGWEEEPEGGSWGEEFLAKDFRGKKIRLTMNSHNRPFDRKHAEGLAYDHLNRRWRFNGESMVFGKYGNALSGQHRGFALVLAQQMLDEANSDVWKENWPGGELTMETVLVFGVEELPEVTRTLDNVKPRSLADVLFTDSGVFANAKASERNVLVRVVDYAVRMLWERTGALNNAWAPRRTHGEALDFLSRHPSVFRCVESVVKTDKEKVIASYFGAGTAAALMYLMSSADSDGGKYHKATVPGEKLMKLNLAEKAKEFWSLFARGSMELQPLRLAISQTVDAETMKPATPEEKLAAVIKCWNLFRADKPLRAEDIRPDVRMKEREKGGLVVRLLAEAPTVGGIDVGPAKALPDLVDTLAPTEDEPAPEGGDPELPDDDDEPGEEEQAGIEARMADERRRKAADVSATLAKLKERGR